MIQSVRIVFFLLFLVLSFDFFGQDTNLYCLQNSEKYADYLFQSQKFGLAKEEYSRLYFMQKQNLVYQTRLLKSYDFSGDIKGGLEQAKTMYVSDSLFPDTVAQAFLHLLFHSEYRYRTEVFLNSTPIIETQQKNLYLTANYLLDNKIEQAKTTFQENDSNIFSQNIQTILISDSLFRSRSKTLAVSMSTLVPGLGKVYLGQWKDGLASFVYSSLSAWQSYRGFKQKGVKSFYGWAFLSVGTGFYLGNIYGTGKLHRLRIEKHKNEIVNQTQNVLEASFK